MNGKDLLQALSFAEEDIVAESAEKGGTATPWKRLVALAACFCLVIGCIYAAARITGENAMNHFPTVDNTTATTDIFEVQQSYIHVDWEYLDTLEALVSRSESIIVGKTVCQEESIDVDRLRYTPFSVEVQQCVKGNLPAGEEIQIRQPGGLSEDGKTMFVVPASRFLQVGETYLLFLFAQDENGYYTLFSPGEGDILIKNGNLEIVVEHQWGNTRTLDAALEKIRSIMQKE